MKNNVGVWIDLSKAIIVTIKGDERNSLKLEGVDNRERIPGESKTYTRFGNQFSNLEKQKENKLNQQIKSFLKSVEDQLIHCDALVIFGPANMKQELADLILNNKTLVHKLKGVETADSMTDNQVAAWVDSYFKEQ